MANGSNTLEALISEILRREKNSLQIIEVLRSLTISDQQSLNIEYVLEDGSINTIPVLSYGYLLQKIDELSKNQQNMAGLNSSKVSLKLPDGTTRTIFSSSIPKEPDPISGVPVPVSFKLRNNQVLEELIDPLTVVDINLNGLVPADTKQVQINRLVLNLNTESEITFFNDNYLNANAIDYNTLLTQLAQQGITYDSFEFVSSINLRQARFSGTFDVLRTFPGQRTVVQEGTTSTINIITYKLNGSTYRNNETGADVNLKKGDRLVVNYTSEARTSYEIMEIDTSRNEVELKRVEGFDAPKVGTNIFAIYPNAQEKITVEVTVNRDQYTIMFFKPIEPDTAFIARSWGNGIGMNTSLLLEPTTNVNLSKFFETTVSNVRDSIKEISKDRVVSITEGIRPNAPALSVNDFSVTLINSHKNSLDTDEGIKAKFQEKLTLQSEISKIDGQINSLKNKISSSSFTTTQEENLAKEELRKLNSDRQGRVEQFTTIINEIVSRTREVESFSPKYRVRGFWPVPEAKYKDPVAKTGRQLVVQFIVEYRYLSLNNTATEDRSTKFGADDSQQKGVQSKWTRVLTKPREKITNTQGLLDWSEEDLTNPDVTNINQLDIPITQGEHVEIRIKSLSEAGFPLSPVESDWSESVIIEFPDELATDASTIRKETEDDRIRSLFNTELDALNLNQHLSDQVTIGETYFAHDSANIASPLKTPENKPIPVGQAIINLNNELTALREQIAQSAGQLGVTITDELGKVIATVSKNDTVKVFAGYYNEQVVNALVPKGEIVTKLYYIEIQNLSQADLEVLSYVPGLTTDVLPDDTYTGFVINREEYNNYRRYWETPISLRSINNDNTLLGHHNATIEPFIQIPSYQSSQVKGQYLYARNRDISLSNELYAAPGNPADESFLPQLLGVDGTRSYVWDGGNGNAGNGDLTQFCVHIEHPDLVPGSEFLAKYAQLWNGNGVPSGNVNTSEVFYPFFMHSAYFNEPANSANGLLQLKYLPYQKATTPSIVNFPRKVGFTKNDKYLIGSNTCGAYLFMAPSDHKSIGTNSTVFNEGIIVKNGDDFKLRVPVIFQYRMTDYNGSGNTGTGDLGGFGSSAQNNLEYTKKIGIDIAIKNQELFSFDLEVQAIYKASSIADVST